MSGAQQAIEAFIEGRIDFQDLQRTLETTLGHDVERVHSLIGDLEGRRDEGLLTPALFNIVESALRRQAEQEVADETLPDAMPAVTLQYDDTRPEKTLPGFSGTSTEVIQPVSKGAHPAEITADLAPPRETRNPAPPARGPEPARSPERPPGARLFQGRQALREGDLLAGRYQLEATLGRGGLGIVYRAVDELRGTDTDQRGVAIKVLRPEYIGNDSARRMLEHEADQARRLSHPNIIKVFDYDRDGEVWFITMELLRGERLKTMLARRHPEPLSGSEARRIIRAAANGLAHAHQRGIVHGDVKPSNIFVPNSGDVRLMDFGQAAAVAGGDAGASPMPARTPAYCSPERLGGEGPSTRDDVFALGCVAYEALTGHHPFARLAADEARARRMKLKRPAGVSGDEWRALSASLAFAAESRPADAAEFARRFFGGGREKPSTERAGAGTMALLGAIALGAVLGYLLGVLVPADAWLPVRGGSTARLETPAADPGSSQINPAPEPAAAPAGEETEWVAPPALATVEIQSEAGSTEMSPGAPAEAGPEDSAADEEAVTEPPPPVSVAVSGPGTIGLAQEEIRLSESDGVAVVDFLRSGGTEGSVAVSYRTIPVTADELSDYAGVDWTEVRFAPGQETARQFVPLVGDSLSERTENFVVEIGRPQDGAELGAVTRMRIVILDDD